MSSRRTRYTESLADRATPPLSESDFVVPSNTPPRQRDPYAVSERKWSKPRARAAKTQYQQRQGLNWEFTPYGRSALLARRTVPFTPRYRRRQQSVLSDADGSEDSLLAVESELLVEESLDDLPQAGISDEEDDDVNDIDHGDNIFDDGSDIARPSSPSLSIRSDDSTDTKIAEEDVSPSSSKGKERQLVHLPVDEVLSSSAYTTSGTSGAEKVLVATQRPEWYTESLQWTQIRDNLTNRGLISVTASVQETLEVCAQKLRDHFEYEDGDRIITSEDRQMYQKLVATCQGIAVKDFAIEQSMAANFKAMDTLLWALGTVGRLIGHN